MNKERLKGHLDLLLLAAVNAGAAHGYLIARRLAQSSGGALELPEGTLYPALHRLESKELLKSCWATVGGRRRRIYNLTPAGRETLAQERPPDLSSSTGKFCCDLGDFPHRLRPPSVQLLPGKKLSSTKAHKESAHPLTS